MPPCSILSALLFQTNINYFLLLNQNGLMNNNVNFIEVISYFDQEMIDQVYTRMAGNVSGRKLKAWIRRRRIVYPAHGSRRSVECTACNNRHSVSTPALHSYFGTAGLHLAGVAKMPARTGQV